MIIEPAIAEAAARHTSAADLLTLEACAQRFGEAADDTPLAIAAVADFFSALAVATANRALIVCQEPLLRLLQSSLQIMLKGTPRGHARIVLAQRHLIEAITARDAPSARYGWRNIFATSAVASQSRGSI